MKLLFPLFLSSLAEYTDVFSENTVGFAVKGKIHLCQWVGVFFLMFCLLAETSSLPFVHGNVFFFQMWSFILLQGWKGCSSLRAEEPIYNIGIMADLKPGNLWINRTIKESLIILVNKHSLIPKGIVRRVYRPDISWEKAFHTITVLCTAGEILKK